MNSGAHVVAEALRNGMLALAALLTHARDDAAILPGLQQQTAARSPLFSPPAERAALLALLARLMCS